MKLLLLITTFLISYNFVQAQEGEINKALYPKRSFDYEIIQRENVVENKFDFLQKENTTAKEDLRKNVAFEIETSENFESDEFEVSEEETELDVEEISFLKPEKEKFDPKLFLAERLKKPPAETNENAEKFHWKPALIESFYFLGIQHSFRMLQKKTRNELDGPFFRDWATSAKNLGGWRDGDSFITNYVAHPMQGAVTGRIFLNNSDRSKKLEFGKSKEYWQSRFKAMVWSAAWSTQFELGPFSEASIGNVGLYDKVGPNRMGWVDLVVTPTAGTAVLIGEDMIDKFILKRWVEKRIKSRTRIKIYRTFLTPIQSFTNVLGGRAPWRRDNR
jgi:hypothetical protein